MRLLVDRLSDSPAELQFEPSAAWWQEARAAIPELPEEALDTLHFAVRAHRMGEDVYLEGGAEGSLELVCGRCLNRYRHALQEDFRWVLEPAGQRVPADPEGAQSLARDGVWLGDDLESGWFRGPEIDLGPCFREVIALALPVQPVCREECQGLCPRCGVDRNQERCECVPVSAHSPFAVLGAMKGDPGRGRG
ncbi:MAG: DUF177 domain-containing protein [Myxococcota bacterium]